MKARSSLRRGMNVTMCRKKIRDYAFAIPTDRTKAEGRFYAQSTVAVSINRILVYMFTCILTLCFTNKFTFPCTFVNTSTSVLVIKQRRKRVARNFTIGSKRADCHKEKAGMPALPSLDIWKHEEYSTMDVTLPWAERTQPSLTGCLEDSYEGYT